jgi:Protein of unknown function (DUF3237)
MYSRSFFFAAAIFCISPKFAIAAPPTAPAEDVPTVEFAFEEIVTLAPAVKVGRTPRGIRQFIPITGGTFQGPRIQGKILPGGWDWQLIRADGCTDLEADYMIQAEDGTIINVRNKGTISPSADGKSFEIKTIAVFEAPLGPHQWLNQSAFAGTLGLSPIQGQNAVRIRFYRIK